MREAFTSASLSIQVSFPGVFDNAVAPYVLILNTTTHPSSLTILRHPTLESRVLIPVLLLNLRTIGHVLVHASRKLVPVL